MKKAEIQMQETILVIFIITIIIAFGLFVFYRYNLNAVENSRLEYGQVKVYNLLATLPNDPELYYSSLGNSENAVDTSKLLNLNLENFGEKEIKIKQVYPSQNSEVICKSSNYPECNAYLIYSKKFASSKNVNIISTPVSLYFPLTNEFKPGLLEIKWHY